ncbi:hypothetical protein ACGH2B_00895 [Streptomyces sp. BBFR2]|uniref:hypothetical protein n=1 Tax=Streptomyces sp. BBFR2 TaxID=3372854 RepID=UPI0037DA5C7A
MADESARTTFSTAQITGVHMPTNDAFRPPDEADFPQLLERALATREIAEALRRADGDPDAGQLRTEALRSVTVIAAAAQEEYRAYHRFAVARAAARPPVRPLTRATGGVLPALGVLVPGLAAVAAAIFLLLGFGLRAVGLQSPLADELIVAGEIAAAVAAVAALCGLLWVLAAAARNRPSASGRPTAETEAARALTVYREALVTRGLLPFLRARLGDAAGKPGAAGPPVRERPGPGFSAPDFAGPHFASPDFTSPDFGGPGGAAER